MTMKVIDNQYGRLS